MDPLSQIQISSLMKNSAGDPNITIGIIDGPVDIDHPAFVGSRIKTVKDSQFGACKNAGSLACTHGTFIIGILSGKRGPFAPALCPDCQLILYPIFREEKASDTIRGISLPIASPEELAEAIIETVNAGAKIINLSLGPSASSLTLYQNLQEAYDYALKKHVIMVVAAGNQGNIGNNSLINHRWVIPVAACDESGKLDQMSNFGPIIGNRGVMAPGVNIRSTYPGGGYTYVSGTSFAAPFVTGAVALLWSLFRRASAEEIVRSLLPSVTSYHRSIVPPLLDCKIAFDILSQTSNHNRIVGEPR